jgi:hypothetical protein
MEKLMRFQAGENLRKREELCERGKRAQNNYETLLKEVKKTSLADRNIIGELRKKNNELELEICEMRKLKEKWVNDCNTLAELRIRVGVLENEKNAFGVQNSELEKSKKNNEAFVGSDNVQTNEPPSKRSKNAQGASSSVMKIMLKMHLLSLTLL